MRKRILLIIFACLGFTSANLYAGGGPDAYGYTWIDSNDPGGPTFAWIDILAMNAIRVNNLGDDNSSGPASMGFDFHYYWYDVNTVKFGSNGWLSFDNVGNIASCYPSVPTPGGAGDNIIAPMMSDMNFNSSFPANPNVGEMWYWSNNLDTFIVTYKNVPWWANATVSGPPDWRGSNTFQVIFSGADSTIKFQYQSTTPSDLYVSAGCAVDCEIGIENITGNIGLSVLQNTIPGNGHVIHFLPPATTSFQIMDATPAWNGSSDNQGQFVQTGASLNMKTNIANVGNTAFSTTTNVSGELLDLPLNSVWTDNATVVNQAPGTDTTITFPNAVSINTAGQYYYNVSVNNAADINPSNNDNTVEISAIDCLVDSMKLSYATGNLPDGNIGWAGGGDDDGVGILIVPPKYPIKITSVEVWIEGDGDTLTPLPVGFGIEIFEENAGNPGTRLDSVGVAAGNVLEGGWNSVVIASQPAITSGGFFVTWLQGGTGISIGTETFGPISRRTFEILSGTWATYRAADITDFLINVNIEVSCLVGVEDDLSSRDFEMTLYPNPARDYANISYLNPTSGDIALTVVDMFGQKVVDQKIHAVAAGEHMLLMNTNRLSAGIYFVNLEMNGEKLSQKLVITK